MKNTHSLGILAAAALLGGATLSAAQPAPAGERPGAPMRDAAMERPQPPPPGADMAAQLKRAGATDAQIEKLTDLDFDVQEKQIDLRAKAEKAELSLRRLMQAPTADEKAVLEAADAINQARGELFKLELTTQLKRKQVLGDEVMRKLRPMPPPENEMRDRREPERGTDDRRPQQMDGARPPMADGPRPPRAPEGAPEKGER